MRAWIALTSGGPCTDRQAHMCFGMGWGSSASFKFSVPRAGYLRLGTAGSWWTCSSVYFRGHAGRASCRAAAAAVTVAKQGPCGWGRHGAFLHRRRTEPAVVLEQTSPLLSRRGLQKRRLLRHLASPAEWNFTSTCNKNYTHQRYRNPVLT